MRLTTSLRGLPHGKLRCAGGARRRPLRGGGALLELVLALPIVIMLCFGAADYGYLLYVKNTVQSASEAGARAGVAVGAVNTDVTTAVTNMMNASGFASTSYTTSITDLNGNALDLSTVGTGVSYKVTVSCTWGTVGLHALPTCFGGISNSKTVNGVCAMVTE